MNLSLKGVKANAWDYPLDFVTHRGRRMTDGEVRTVVNYGIANCYEYSDEIPDEVVDAICELGNDEYKAYEDKETDFVSTRRVIETLAAYIDDEDVIAEIMCRL